MRTKLIYFLAGALMAVVIVAAGALAVQGPLSAQGQTTGPQWDYLIFIYDPNNLTGAVMETNYDDPESLNRALMALEDAATTPLNAFLLDSYLAAIGDQGWELVGIEVDGVVANRTSFVFKRPG